MFRCLDLHIYFFINDYIHLNDFNYFLKDDEDDEDDDEDDEDEDDSNAESKADEAEVKHHNHKLPRKIFKYGHEFMQSVFNEILSSISDGDSNSTNSNNNGGVSFSSFKSACSCPRWYLFT